MPPSAAPPLPYFITRIRHWYIKLCCVTAHMDVRHGHGHWWTLPVRLRLLFDLLFNLLFNLLFDSFLFHSHALFGPDHLVRECYPGIRLSQPDGTNWRMAEDHRRNLRSWTMHQAGPRGGHAVPRGGQAVPRGSWRMAEDHRRNPRSWTGHGQCITQHHTAHQHDWP